MAFTGGGEVIGEATVEIGADLRPLQAALTQLSSQLDRLARSSQFGTQIQNQANQATKALQQTTRSAAEARAQFVEMAIGLEVAGRSLTQFISRPLANFLKRSALEASNLNEIISQTRVILGESADASIEWAENLSSSFGLTNAEALTTQNNFALLFNEIGVGMEGSVEIAQQLAERIGDLASFKDFPIEQVIQRVQSGLVGETEAVRRLGIILDESVIKQKAFEQGIIGTGEALSTQQKFLLRAQQILEQTSEAQGDAARTADTFAGQMREMRANASDLRTELGNAFLPILTDVLTQINNLLVPLAGMAKSFAEAEGPIQEIVLAFVGLVGILGPLATGAGRIAIIFRTIGSLGGTAAANGIKKLTANMQNATGAAGLFAKGLTGIGKALPIIGTGLFAFSLLQGFLGRSKDSAVDLDEAITKLKNNITDAPRAAAGEFLGLSAEQLNSVTEELALLNAELFTQNRLQKQAEAQGKQTGGRLSIDLPGISSDNRAEQALKARDALQKKVNEGIASFTGLVEKEQFALAQSIITSTTDIHLKERLQTILREGISTKRENIILGQRQNAIDEAIAQSTKSVADQEKDHLQVLKDIASELRARANLDQQRIRADKEVADARKRLKDANDDLLEAEQELNALRAEGVIDLEAVARAEEDVADARERLAEATLDLQEAQQAATLEELQEGLDDITRAEINLTRVRRENQAAVDALNKSLEKSNQIQRISLNLAGLNLDQIRSAVGNARASAEALRQVQDLDETKNETQKTAAELQEEAILREIEERDALRRLNDAKEEQVRLTKQGSDADERVIEARKRQKDAEIALTQAEEARRQAGLPDQARQEAIAAAEERKADAQERQQEAQQGIKDAEAERITTLRDIAIELAFINEDEQAINAALTARFGLNEQLAEQARRFARERARETAASALNSLSFDNIGALGRGLAKAAFLSPQMINLLTEQLIQAPGAPIRALLKRIGVPDSLLAGFKDGGVITKPMVANIGEGYKAEAVVPLTNARNAIAALQKGWGYMAPALKQQLAPALAPTLHARPQTGFAMTHGTYTRRATPELQTLQAILLRLESTEVGTTHIEAPITLAAPNSDLAARKIQRELRKLQAANRGRDARMR